MQIDIPQPENTTRYWCPIDVPNSLNTEENEMAFAKMFCGWAENSQEDRKTLISKMIRRDLTEKYRQLLTEIKITEAKQQVDEFINNTF